MTKSVSELTYPDDICYFSEHTWVRKDGDLVRVGITDFAQDSLGDLIFIELPSVGEIYGQGTEFGEAESAKTTSALYMPVSGEIVEVNTALEDNPEKVNEDPYGDGWMVIVKPDRWDEIDALLSREDYLQQVAE